MSLNVVCISGNLTREPDLRTTAGGIPVLSLGIAVNERVKDASGNWSDRANFIDCVMLPERAESVSQYLAKGTKVAIEGKLRYSSWERDGQKRSKLEVIVDELEFMSKGQQERQPAKIAPQPDMFDEPVPF